jgi:hypothetical protein
MMKFYAPEEASSPTDRTSSSSKHEFLPFFLFEVPFSLPGSGSPEWIKATVKPIGSEHWIKADSDRNT